MLHYSEHANGLKFVGEILVLVYVVSLTKAGMNQKAITEIFNNSSHRTGSKDPVSEFLLRAQKQVEILYLHEIKNLQ